MDNIMNKKIIFLFFLFFLFFNLFSDETDDTIQAPSLDKYKEILTFGIEEEVVNILNNFGNSPGNDIYTLISDRYKEALLPNTKIAIIRYFSKCTNLPDNIITMLYEDAKKEPENLRIFTALLSFLGEKGKTEHGLFLIKCLDNYEDLIKHGAADALAEMENVELVKPLLTRLKESETIDEKYLTDDIKGKLILSLGKTKSMEASDYLKSVANEPSNNKYLIMYSMVSLAEIQDIDSINIIKDKLNDEEIRIQEYAGYALSKFKSSTVLPYLKKMLKHNNEKIRIFACQGIVNNNDTKSTNILLYKFKNDPSTKVKYEALRSLVYLGSEGITSIKNYMGKKKLQNEDIYIISEAVAKKPNNINVEFLNNIYENSEEKQKDIIAKNIINGTSNKLDPIIDKLLKSKNQYVRVNAIKTIFNIKDSSLWNKVKELSQNDPSSLVKKMAKYYLEIKK
jgi:HEAT repeat protein